MTAGEGSGPHIHAGSAQSDFFQFPAVVKGVAPDFFQSLRKKDFAYFFSGDREVFIGAVCGLAVFPAETAGLYRFFKVFLVDMIRKGIGTKLCRRLSFHHFRQYHRGIPPEGTQNPDTSRCFFI